MVDAEARVEHHVQLVQDPARRRARLDLDVGAHGLAPGGERPHVEIVHALDPPGAAERGLDLRQVEVGGDTLEEHVDRLFQQRVGARQDQETDDGARQRVRCRPARHQDHHRRHDHRG